jgi:hypothetical protein
MLVEYKPFEPAFYATDIADWGMAFLLAKKAGPRAKVLVDTGHHYVAQNIEQIVAWLLDEDMLGGFHFNDRRYADDDLTLGSIDPYQVFRIFHEIHAFAADREIDFATGGEHGIACLLRIETTRAVAPQQAVLGIFEQRVFIASGALLIGGAGHDELVQRLQFPATLDKQTWERFWQLYNLIQENVIVIEY